MKVGRAHKWYYDQGVWNEKKVTPEEWEINSLKMNSSSHFRDCRRSIS